MIVAMFLFFGGITFMGALFSSAGGPKSQQLRVLGEAVRVGCIPTVRSLRRLSRGSTLAHPETRHRFSIEEDSDEAL